MDTHEGSARRRGPRLSARIFNAGLAVAGAMAQRPQLDRATRAVMRGFAGLTMAAKRARPQTDVRALAEEWQRMMPSRKLVPITEVDGATAYAEIHGRCPVAGSGDLTACHRMMEYDRLMVGRMGGTFVVLESQAEPGVSVCKVAMRLAGADVSDLVPAHLRRTTNGEGGL